MADDNQKAKESGFPREIIHWVLTFLIGAGTLINGIWQFKEKHSLEKERAALEAQVEQTKLVDQVLDRIERLIDKPSSATVKELRDAKRTAEGVIIEKESISKNESAKMTAEEVTKGLTEKDKTIILISLAKIATETRLGQTGHKEEGSDASVEGESQEDLVRSLPLYFALLSENDDMLATIGYKCKDRKLWVDFAKATGAPEIKETAAKALEKIALLTKKASDQAIIIKDLTDLVPDPRQMMDLKNPFTEVLRRVSEGVDPAQAESFLDLGTALQELNEKLLEFETSRVKSTEEIADEVSKLEEDEKSSQPRPPLGQINPDILQKTYQIMAQRGESQDISLLVKNLESTDTDIRRSARNKLAVIGQEAVPSLMDVLNEKGGKVYRVRVGVVTALLLMKQPVVLTEQQVPFVTNLLGDTDSTVRKNSANFLISETDPETLKSIIDELFSNFEPLDNANKVYNSVVVMGELAQRWKNHRDYIHNKLKDIKGLLESDRQPWRKSIMQIDKYIAKVK